MSSSITPAPAWRGVIAAEWAARRAADVAAVASPPLFPLAANPFGEEEILAMTEVLLSGRLTMGENVECAEREFAAAVARRRVPCRSRTAAASARAAAWRPQRPRLTAP